MLATLLLILAAVAAITFAVRGGVMARFVPLVAALTVGASGIGALWWIVNALTGAPLSLSVPVRLALGVDERLTIQSGPTARLNQAEFDVVSVTAEGLSLGTRALYCVAVGVTGAAVVALALVVWRLARSAGEGDPFRHGGAALAATAWIVAIGGVLAAVLTDIAAMRASRELFELTAWSMIGVGPDGAELADLGWPAPGGDVTVPFWPLGAGVVCSLLAGVLRHGARLRADTQGLV